MAADSGKRPFCCRRHIAARSIFLPSLRFAVVSKGQSPGHANNRSIRTAQSRWNLKERTIAAGGKAFDADAWVRFRHYFRYRAAASFAVRATAKQRSTDGKTSAIEGFGIPPRRAATNAGGSSA